jgi:hypothetical protein
MQAMECHMALVITCAYSDALAYRRVRYSFIISEVPASKPSSYLQDQLDRTLLYAFFDFILIAA